MTTTASMADFSVDDDDDIPSGVMVALFLPPALASKVALPGGDAPSELHLTLAYLGDADELEDPASLRRTVAAWAAATPAIVGQIAGVGLFTAGPEPVTYLSIDAPELPAARQRLLDALGAFDVSMEHGFTPHVTLAYDARVTEPDVGGETLTFAAVSVCVGPDRNDYALGAQPVTTGGPAPDPELFSAYDPETDPLTPQQEILETTYDQIVDELGRWDQDDVSVEYSVPGDSNPGAPYPMPSQGQCCANCAGWSGLTPQLIAGQVVKMGTCRWVSGPIDPRGVCKLSLIPPDDDENGDDDFDIDTPTMQQPMAESQPGTSSVHVPAPMSSMSVANFRLPYGSDVMAKDAALRYTLAPWYVPNKLDAHGEWTDAEQLRATLWRYSEMTDRAIRLQHNTAIVAGRWVELMMWPYPCTVQMINPQTGKTQSVELPANTAFLGVVWEPWAWLMVLDGRILGYSMGGSTGVIEVEIDPSVVDTSGAPTS